MILVDVDRIIADAIAASTVTPNRDVALCPATACGELCGPGTARPCSCPPCECAECRQRRTDARLRAQRRIELEHARQRGDDPTLF